MYFREAEIIRQQFLAFFVMLLIHILRIGSNSDMFNDKKFI